MIHLPSCLCAVRRTDPDRHHYSGALCGLGPHPNTGAPLFEDHDVEITFDTQITRRDFEDVGCPQRFLNLFCAAVFPLRYSDLFRIALQVLKIRQGINFSLSNVDGMVLWPESNMHSLMEVQRELLLS